MRPTVFKKSIAAALTALLLLSIMFPICAAEVAPNELTDYDAEKLLAFWQHEAYGGFTNAQILYQHEWMPIGENCGYYEFSELPPDYDGGPVTFLMQYSPDSPYFSLALGTRYTHWCVLEDENGVEYSYDEYDFVDPDFYGPLNLSGTHLISLGSPDYDKTHITGVNLDNCADLESFTFFGQRYCTEFSAVNCASLLRCQVLDCDFQHIALQPFLFDEPIELASFGSGSVGVTYSVGPQHDSFECWAYPGEGSFLGWYENGECISTELRFYHEGAGSLIACFGGDADGNGSITVADAIIALRAAMQLIPDANTSVLDINGNGTVDVADALMIMRFAMGTV